MQRLVLFDIDETMVASAGAGKRALEQAMTAVLGQAISCEGHSLSGKTDPQICSEVLAAHEFSPKDIAKALPAILDKYIPCLEQSVQSSSEFRIHQGVMELLERLQKLPQAYLGLLTGNIEPGARIKLSRFDLNRFFSFGAFGCDSHDRMDLPAIAHERAGNVFKQSFAIKEIVIIGDARNDVLCAKGYGAKSLAVCTGKTTKQTLVDLQPDFLFDDLAHTDNVLTAIFT